MQKEEMEYKYTLTRKASFYLIVAGVVLSVFSYFEAANNTQGMIFIGIVELGLTGANIVLWGIFFNLLLLVLLGLYSFYENIRGKTRLVLTDKALLFPVLLFKTNEIVMRYSKISDLSFRAIGSVPFLSFKYMGKKHLIASNRFKSKEGFEDFVNALSARVKL